MAFTAYMEKGKRMYVPHRFNPPSVKSERYHYWLIGESPKRLTRKQTARKHADLVARVRLSSRDRAVRIANLSMRVLLPKSGRCTWKHINGNSGSYVTHDGSLLLNATVNGHPEDIGAVDKYFRDTAELDKLFVSPDLTREQKELLVPKVEEMAEALREELRFLAELRYAHAKAVRDVTNGADMLGPTLRQERRAKSQAVLAMILAKPRVPYR